MGAETPFFVPVMGLVMPTPSLWLIPGVSKAPDSELMCACVLCKPAAVVLTHVVWENSTLNEVLEALPEPGSDTFLLGCDRSEVPASLSASVERWNLALEYRHATKELPTLYKLSALCMAPRVFSVYASRRAGPLRYVRLSAPSAARFPWVHAVSGPVQFGVLQVMDKQEANLCVTADLADGRIRSTAQVIPKGLIK